MRKALLEGWLRKSSVPVNTNEICPSVKAPKRLTPPNKSSHARQARAAAVVLKNTHLSYVSIFGDDRFEELMCGSLLT